jgi:uncharacterized protein involved in response to NO
MLNIQERNGDYGIALFRLGFRPFFLGAGLFSIVAVAIWFAIYVMHVEIPLPDMPPAIWHAHEMIFGYAIAVIAGFLLTAIKNWTGQQTLRGGGLAALFGLWVLARALPFAGQDINIAILAAVDLSFMAFLLVAASIPVLKVKQYSQISILSKLALLMLSNVMFYLGVTGVLQEGVSWGLYSGLYMVIALVLVMARRVVPFFIEKGIDGDANIRNWRSVDLLSLVFLLALWVIDVFTPYTTVMSMLAGILFLLHVIRMAGWYTSQLWSKPLLWVLYLAYGSIVTGFALKFMQLWFELSPFLAVHAFAYGGIGVMTLGMMSRVILGHTGRNISEPPSVLFWCFLLLVCGTAVRVFLPLFNMELYIYWVGISQLLWALAFGLFVVIYAPMLWSPRVDGRDG